MRAKNEKLLKEAEAYKEKTKTLENELKKSKQCQIHIQTLKEKLSEETAHALVLEEENKKLRRTLEMVSKEKTDLIGQMAQKTGTTDMLEEKIENKLLSLEDTFLKEMSELKQQLEKSMQLTENRMSHTPSQTKTKKQNTQEKTNTVETGIWPQQPQDNNHSVFIAGDSVTSILSRKKISDAINVQV